MGAVDPSVPGLFEALLSPSASPLTVEAAGGANRSYSSYFFLLARFAEPAFFGAALDFLVAFLAVFADLTAIGFTFHFRIHASQAYCSASRGRIIMYLFGGLCKHQN